MEIYHYDEQGRFAGMSIAEADPMEPGKFLIPARATAVKPPEVSEGFEAVCDGEQWAIAKRQQKPLDDAGPSAEDLRRLEIGEQLQEIDRQKIRPTADVVAALATSTEPPKMALSKLAALELQAAALRKELAGLK